MARWNRRRSKTRRVDRLRPEGVVPWYGHLKSSQVRWQVGILFALLIGTLLIVQMPRPPLSFRKGERKVHPVLSRVDFEYIDRQVTADVKELTALLRVPGVYSPDARQAIAMRENLLALTDEIVKAKTFKELPAASRDAWKVDAGMFAAVKTALGESAANLAAVQEAIAQAAAALAKPLSLPIIQTEDYQRALVRVARFRDIRKQLPAGLSPDIAPVLEEPTAEIVVQLPEGDQTVGLDKITILTQTDIVQSRIRRLIEPALKPVFGSSGVALLAVAMAPRIGPTLVYDQAKTENGRADVKRKVRPVPVLHKAETTLVEAGAAITEADLEVLKQEQEAHLGRLRWPRTALAWVSAVVILLVLVSLQAGYTARFQAHIARSVPRSLMLVILSLVVVGTSKLAAQGGGAAAGPAAVSTFLVTAAGMIVAIAYSQTFALTMVWTLVLLVSVATRAELGWAMMTVAGTGIGILALGEINNRSKLIKVGALAGLVFLVVRSSLAFWRLDHADLQPAMVPPTVLWPSFLCFCAGLAAGIVMLAMLPGIERLFGIVTNISLLELCDVNQPALKRLALEAPGTYAHSLLIGTLSEAAAETIGANGLLARVGAYFHDIGKANKPRYFVENDQQGEKAHGGLTPAMSRLIIMSHVKDGREMADRLGLPPVIKDFIAEHHGTTCMEYFYHEAKQQAREAGEDPPDESDYRYAGPKPRSPETAIVMLADAAEGATRSLKEQTATRVGTTVHDMIMTRLLEGQLDNSSLTLNNLHKIEETLTKTLLSVYHGRVPYPSQDEVGGDDGTAAEGDAAPKHDAHDTGADTQTQEPDAPAPKQD
jgi:putative nucleotidyltransferase with HDIG domain